MGNRFRAPRIRSCLLALAALITCAAAFAQDAPLNISPVSNFDQSGQNYADVWGDGNYAYLAHRNQSRVDIIDISVPSNPQLAATYNSGIGSAQDVKVGDGLMFVGLDSASPGVHIVDVRDPGNPVKLTNMTVRNDVHNLFYDEGWLFIADSSNPTVDIVDLRAYDPDNAPATISSATWTLTGIGSFVHDITVQGGFLFASAWNGLYVFDISNIANQAPALLATAAGQSVHSAWATDDLNFVVTAEERTGGGLKLWEIIQNGQPGEVSLVQTDSYTFPTSRATSVHNPVIKGYTVYVSWYEIGAQIFEIDPVLKRFSLTASFDTTPANGNTGFTGAWGIYPFLGDDRILASDMNTGLWVLDADLISAPTIALSGACPGHVTVNVSAATPHSRVAVVSAANIEGFLKRGNKCNGSLLTIGKMLKLPPTWVRTDPNGDGTGEMSLQSGFCYVQALDTGNCRVSNLVDFD